MVVITCHYDDGSSEKIDVTDIKTLKNINQIYLI